MKSTQIKEKLSPSESDTLPFPYKFNKNKNIKKEMFNDILNDVLRKIPEEDTIRKWCLDRKYNEVEEFLSGYSWYDPDIPFSVKRDMAWTLNNKLSLDPFDRFPTECFCVNEEEYLPCPNCEDYLGYYNFFEKVNEIYHHCTRVNKRSYKKFRWIRLNVKRLIKIFFETRKVYYENECFTFLDTYTNNFYKIIPFIDLRRKITFNKMLDEVLFRLREVHELEIPHFILGVSKLLENKFEAQSGENFVMSQSVSDKIDSLINDLSKIEAQGLFNVSHEHNVNISASTTSRLMDILNDLKKSVKGILYEVFKFSIVTIAAILYIVLAYTLIMRLISIKPRYMIAVHILCSLMIIYVDENGGPVGLINWCKEKFMSNDSTGYVAQEGSLNTNLLSFVPLIIINFLKLPAEISTKIINSKFLDSLARKLSFLGDQKFYNGINCITDWVKTAFETVKSHVCYWIGVEYTPNLTSEDNAVTKWAEKCEKCIDDYNQKKMLYSESTRSYLSSLYMEGCQLNRHPIYKLLGHSILLTCKSLLIIIEKINSRLNVNGSIRNPPVTIMLHGDTGAGKSSLTLPLSIAILKEIYKRQKNIAMLTQLQNSWKTLIYTRNAEQEYWDGYTGQQVCVFDDWNQLVDSTSNPSMELFELIRASNVFPYPLHMAHLEDKATVNFTSDVIICSSNNKIPKVESLNFPKALIRRFTKFVTVERRKGEETGFDFKSYSVTSYDPETGDPFETMCIEEFVQQIVDSYEENRQFVGTINNFVTEKLLNFDPNLIIQNNDIIAQSGFSDWYEEDSKFVYVCNPTGDIFTQSTMLSISDKIKNFAKKFSFLNCNLTYVLGAIGLISAGVYLYKTVFSSNENQSEGIEELSQHVRTRINARKNKLKEDNPSDEAYEITYKNVKTTTETYESLPKPTKLVEAYETTVKPIKVTEACTDLVATEMGIQIARSNLYRIYLETEENTISLGHVLFLVSNIAIMPKHFVLTLNEHEQGEVYFASPTVGRAFPIRVKDLVFKDYVDIYGRQKDLVSFRVPSARQHADIRSKFANAPSLSAVGSTQVALVTINCLSPKQPLVIDRRFGKGNTCIRRLDDGVEYFYKNKSSIKIHDAWEYTALETQKGDCGAPLLATNERISPGKVLGIHVAGGVGIGFSTTLFYEDAKAICSEYEKVYAQLNTIPIVEVENPYKDCELMFIGKLEKPVIQPSKSKITESVVHGLIREPVTKRTWLRPGIINGELFDPLDYRTRRMGKPSVAVPFEIVDKAKHGVLREFKRIYLKHQEDLVGRFKCPYSLEETCLGVEGEDFVNAIKRDTSCGFPFVQMGINRKQIFGDDDIYDITGPYCKEIFDLVKLYDKAALDGIVYDHYFVDTLKDERKPIDKAHKSRMFAAGPIDYLIWCKKWFNGIVAIISELRNKIHISVGTNVYSTDWHEMAEQMLRKSDKFVAGDFEGFDASEQLYVLNAAAWVLIEFNQYIFGKDEDTEKIMWAIVIGLFNSHHVSEGNVFQWLKSLPSGHYLTAIMNSILLLIVMSGSYLIASQKEGILITDKLVDQFWEENDLVSYGDDHILAVSSNCVHYFNQNSLVDLIRNFGMFYTDELKSTNKIADYRKITEISYLKRKFLFDDDIKQWVAPLDLNVILETPMWIRKCPDIYLQTFNNIEFSLRELSLHPIETWNEWAPLLIQLCEERCNMVTGFQNKNETKIFVLNSFLCQSGDVIFNRLDKMQECKIDCMLSTSKAVDIHPYFTGSAQAAPKNPVYPARLYREGALKVETISPAETYSIQTNEVKDVKYQDQVANDDIVQITTFENDMSVATQDVPMPAPMDLGLRSMHTDDAHHTITSFLKRPMILREFVWESSQTRGKDIFDKIRIPFDMIVRQFKDKLQGFTSFRATAVINVQFQTQPFQAGRCIIAAVPLPHLIGKRVKIIEERISNLTLLNHVQADIAKQTEVTLRVPYVSPLIAYDLVQGKYNWAEVVGKVYSPVASVGNTKIEGIVYVHFEDIQLGAPTSMPVFSDVIEAQSGDEPKKRNNKKVPFEPEVLTDVRQRAQELGATASNSSRITGGARKLNNSIAEYITPLKPVTDALDKYILKPLDDFVGPILNIFGFSKPLTVADDKLLRPTTNFATFHGTDRALTLATSEDVNAPFLPHLNGSMLDEMSFDYLKKIPQYIDQFNYATTNNRNDVLYTFYVRPTFKIPERLKFTYNAPKIIDQPSHLAYITEPFLYWTGSIVLTFKFVKTDYHSGRVEITYHPNCNPLIDNRKVKDKVDFDMAYRFIIDLREKNEVSLKIPYVAVTPFKRNVSTLLSPSDTKLAAIENNSGVVIVRALTPLKASNAVVSNKIEVLVEYNAGNDFQVMNPVTCRYNPITPLENKATTLRDLAIEAQSGEASVAGLAITRQQAIEGEDPPSITNNLGENRADSSTFAVTGENFSNFRDLCHRTNFVLRVEKKGYFAQALHRFYIPPPCSRPNVNSGELPGFYYNNRGNSALGYVGAMYALCRGSVNVRILPDNYEGYISAKLFSQQSKTSDCLFPRAIEKSNIKGLAEFHVPYYCRTYQFDHLKYDESSLYDLEFGIAVPRPTEITASAAVSGGDDMSFGYFVGTPVTLYPEIVLSSGGADPFDNTTQKQDYMLVVWDDISVIVS